MSPAIGYYVVEIVYLAPTQQGEALDSTLAAGLDLNLDNLVGLAPNKPGFQPFRVNGRPLKSLSRFYNKTRAEWQSHLPDGKHDSSRLSVVTNRRNRRVKAYRHKTSRLVVGKLVEAGIGTLVIGYNQGGKQEIETGRVNNQKFVSIPHAQLVEMMTDKARLAGLKVIGQTRATLPNARFLTWRRLALRPNIWVVASIAACFGRLTDGSFTPMSTAP